MSIRIPLILGLVGFIEFCIIFVYIHEKPLPLFSSIPMFLTPEKIHCGLINLLIIDLAAKTVNNCSIIDKFEQKFQILNNSGKFFSFVVSSKCSDTSEIFFCLKSYNCLFLVVSVFAWPYQILGQFLFFYCSTY